MKYLAQIRHLLSLHLKIPKPGEDRITLTVANVGGQLATSSCLATTALPCPDSLIFLF